MEERVLITSYRQQPRLIIAIIGVLGIAILLFAMFQPVLNEYEASVEIFNTHVHTSDCFVWFKQVCGFAPQSTVEEYQDYRVNLAWKYMFSGDEEWGFPAWSWGLIAFLLCSGLSVLIFFESKYYEMVVTNKRIYGKVAFGKRVDIPLDSISAISTLTLLKGVAVASSSGRISFLMMKNAKEMYTEITKLLNNRQTDLTKTEEDKQTYPLSYADELKKCKELLDSGVITQEEFDAKKKQLLGL